MFKNNQVQTGCSTITTVIKNAAASLGGVMTSRGLGFQLECQSVLQPEVTIPTS